MQLPFSILISTRLVVQSITRIESSQGIIATHVHHRVAASHLSFVFALTQRAHSRSRLQRCSRVVAACSINSYLKSRPPMQRFNSAECTTGGMKSQTTRYAIMPPPLHASASSLQMFPTNFFHTVRCCRATRYAGLCHCTISRVACLFFGSP